MEKYLRKIIILIFFFTNNTQLSIKVINIFFLSERLVFSKTYDMKWLFSDIQLKSGIILHSKT